MRGYKSLLATFIFLSCSSSDDGFGIFNPPNGGGVGGGGGGSNNLIVTEIEVPSGFIVTEFAKDLSLPTNLSFAPDGSNRMFVNELQSGRVKIIQNGQVLPQPFIDLETMVSGGFPVDGENGLIGLSFDPDFVNNKWVYLSYAFRTPSGTIGRVARMQDINNTAENFQILLDNLPSAPGHQIESIAFGPDGKLYVSVGDAFEDAKVQDDIFFNGKILRINPDGSVPIDNPNPGSIIWAKGLRNSFGLAFSPSGLLFATENGPNEKDELNLINGGDNLGWPLVLGEANDPQFKDPVHVWQNIVAPTALHFYKGTQFPQKYRNQMFLVLFGRTTSQGSDPISKRIVLGTIVNSGGNVSVNLEDFAVYKFEGGGNPLGITEGPDGSLYISDIFQGKIFKIVFNPSGDPI